MQVSPMITYRIFDLRDPLLHLIHSAMEGIKVLSAEFHVGLYMIHLVS